MARLIEHSPEEEVSVTLAPRQDGWPLIVAGPVAALGAFAMTAVVFSLPVFAIWLTTPDVGPQWDTWHEVAAIAALGWLTALGNPIPIAETTITLVPWGLALIPAGFAILSGRWAARISAVGRAREALAVALSAAVAYAGLAMAMAAWVAAPTGRLLLVAGLGAFAMTGLGVLSGAGLTRSAMQSLPHPVRRITAAATAAVSIVIAAAALAVGISLVLHADDVQRMLIALAPDAAGFIALTLLSLGYLPVLIGWGSAYVLGTGVTVAGGTDPMMIGPFAQPANGELPVFPLLAALPEAPPPGAVAFPVVGLLGGVVLALILKRRGARGLSFLGEAAAAVGVAIGLLWLVLAASSGDLGVERLSGIGPLIGPTLGVAALLFAVGSLIIMVPTLASDTSTADAYPLPISGEDRDNEPRTRQEVGDHGEHHA